MRIALNLRLLLKILKNIYLNQIKMEKILQELLEKVISLIQKREEYF